ncbi:MAG TPA: SUMF1/EgtB/PvdO family nonheme iron enzyme [Anaerolineae bacterium]|nr:SUMF1/EgtB/PvdO family nonheme iron enzyme [Anaerolineae bacterium]
MSDSGKLEKIEMAIRAQEGLRGIVPDEQIEAALEALRQQRARLQAKGELDGMGNIGNTSIGERGINVKDAKVGGSIVTGTVEGLFAGRDINQLIQIVVESVALKATVDLKKATERYLNYLVDRHLYLKFKGMGVSDRVPLKLPLAEMYVPLKARTEMPEGEKAEGRPLRLAGRELSDEEREAIGERLGGPQPIIELLKKHNGLIVLGDPGAGKTTFMKYLAVMLALGQGDELGIGQRLPVLLPLSAYANALAEKDVPLHRFIAEYYEDLGIDEPLAEMLAEAMNQGGALLLLDGLDEVQDRRQRSLVIDRVLEFFAYRQQQGNKFILTSRIVGYRDVRPSTTNMAECTLVDFDEEEIGLFVEKWTGTLERHAYDDEQVASKEAERERGELMEALDRNPGVRQLAANPLLLTILALMKRQGVVLPDRRAELYQQYVETLLRHWNLARSLGGRSAQRDLDVVETLRILAPLALWMQENSPGVGLVKREDVRRKLEAIYAEREVDDPETAARQLLEDAREHANLLVERGAGQYGFIHLTFQEYLAAVAMGQAGQIDLQTVVDSLIQHLGDDTWHEVSLLAIGYVGIIQQNDKVASEILRRFMAAEPGEVGEAVVLAGEAVADAGASGVTPACRREVIEALLAVMGEANAVAPLRRAEAGRVLARVGDPRQGVMTVEAMPMCLVPKGAFWMGSEDGNVGEQPCHQLDLAYDYWLGQYPVTNTQFNQFVEAGGYQEKEYWAEAIAHGRWQDGLYQGRDKPRNHGYTFSLPNHPVVGMSWYEAMAFCRWLTVRVALPEGYRISLPSEAEWEKGAKGGLNVVEEPIVRPFVNLMGVKTVSLVENSKPRRKYPWGDTFESGGHQYANYGQMIKSTTAVGCYPDNVSPYGCVEMAGNVFEWTRTVYGFDYPYEAEDGREELASTKSRRIKGGSWAWGNDALRCAFRDWYYINFDHDNYGFRVMVCP